MINFMSLIFLTDQMVNTRSGSGVDQLQCHDKERATIPTPILNKVNHTRRHLHWVASAIFLIPPALGMLGVLQPLDP
jgi:hypothetical protein